MLPWEAPFLRRIVYDGGSQRSFYYRFDGDLAQARAHYFDLVDGHPRYNIGRYVAFAYWLKRDTPMRALVIGSAGGQEVLAALAFGAARVDAVEMVCAVIEAARGPYAEFTGHLYDHPRVRPVCDEGRSYLRHTPTATTSSRSTATTPPRAWPRGRGRWTPSTSRRWRPIAST